MYRLQGVKINDKHIETIVRQMLQKVEVEDGGDTTLLVGEQVEREEFARANETAEAEGLAPAKSASCSAGHHQGVLADTLIRFCRIIPGNHPRSD